MDLSDLKFTLCQQADNGAFYLANLDPTLEQKAQKHTGLCKWTTDDGWQEIGLVEYETLALFPGTDNVVFTMLSPVGLITDLVPGGAERSLITTPDGEVSRWQYRYGTRVGKHVYATGLNRHVFVREPGAEEFHLISTEAMMDAPGAKAIMGLDGFAPDEIYAVGTEGEIWSYDGADWTRENSGTDITLTAIAAGPDHCVAAGLAGTLVVGRGKEWRPLKQSVLRSDVWGAAYFKGAFYFATTFGVYRLIGDEVEEVPFDGIDMRTCFTLSVGPCGLWCPGTSDVALFDGTSWRMIGQS